MTDNVAQIRSIYEELQGYLSQLPLPKDANESSNDAELAKIIGYAIDKLNTLTSDDYNRFKIRVEDGHYGGFVRIVEYRTKLGGLISSLHSTFFAKEPAPFGGSPSTVITQSQHQSTYVSVLLEMQDKINDKIHSVTDESEKGFLQKVKEGLRTVQNTTELIGLIITTAHSFGISLSRLADLFR